MSYNYTIIPEKNLVLNRIVGALTYREYRTLMEIILNDDLFRPAMDTFWDFRDGTLAELSYEEIEGIRNFIERNQEKRGYNYRVAFLINKTIDYGLSRMYQIVSEDLPVNFEIFYGEQKAMSWIKEKWPLTDS